MTMNSTTVEQLEASVRAGNSVDLIDVRTPVEFREIHVTFARNIPLDQLNGNELSKDRDRNAPLYVICRSGNRSKQGCDKLIAAGFTNVINVAGGTQAWDKAGFAVVRGKKAVSLERQVRIAAGSLVVAGSALGFFVHPYWIALSAFVGAGLVFAGVTDTCGMAMVLAKMPWNKVATTPSSTSAPTPTCSR